MIRKDVDAREGSDVIVLSLKCYLISQVHKKDDRILSSDVTAVWVFVMEQKMASLIITQPGTRFL